MNRESELDVLVVAPHPDDAELGMGGAIVKMLNRGLSVGILDLTSGEPTPYGDVETRERETRQATEILGVTWRRNLGMPNRSLLPTLDHRAAIAGVIRETRPRHLYAPYWVDAHPDHVAATQLVEDARFWAKLTKTDSPSSTHVLPGEPCHPERIYNYYCVHLKMAANPAFILDISDEWPRKLAAIQAYESQFITGREDIRPSFIERLTEEAAYWGKTIGVRYGEPFHCREPIGLTELTHLI